MSLDLASFDGWQVAIFGATDVTSQEMLSWTQRFRSRLWGLVGAYSASITEIAGHSVRLKIVQQQVHRKCSAAWAVFGNSLCELCVKLCKAIYLGKVR